MMSILTCYYHNIHMVHRFRWNPEYVVAIFTSIILILIVDEYLEWRELKRIQALPEPRRAEELDAYYSRPRFQDIHAHDDDF